jgi:hypothetical protein
MLTAVAAAAATCSAWACVHEASSVCHFILLLTLSAVRCSIAPAPADSSSTMLNFGRMQHRLAGKLELLTS